MRIGIDARVLQGERRGQGQYVYYLVKNLLEIDKENEYVLFYNGFKGGKFVFEENIPNLKQVWCRIPGRILKLLWSSFSWPPIELLLGNIDIFHNTLNYNSVHYTPIPTRKKMVETFHGMAAPELLCETYTYNDFKRWAETVASSASIIITVSKMAKENFLQYASFYESRMKIVYLAADPIFRLIEDKEAIRRFLTIYGLNNKGYILYVGGGEENKNLRRLLRAFSVINKKHELYIVLAGGINPATLKDELKDINDRVIFLGHVSHNDLVYLYNGARLFILPTLYEWFGLPVLEAMACGTPVVFSMNTGALEVVGDAALTFDPENTEEMADCMMKVHFDGRLRADMIKNGLEKARVFTWKKTAEETLKVYKTVFETSG